MENYFKYWGKANKEDGSFHLLVYHSLDVAAVAAVWWDNSSAIRHSFVHATGINEAQFKEWVLYFIALHDYGKFDVRFQAKVTTLAKATYPEFPADNPVTRYHHGDGGYMWFVQETNDLTKSKPLKLKQKRILQNWLRETAGHHGSIPSNTELDEPPFVSLDIKQQDKQARLDWVNTLKDLFLTPYDIDYEDVPDRTPSMLAGFCSVCDWIGSNTDYFNSISGVVDDLEAYFKSRCDNAKQALNDLGLVSKPVAAGGMKCLFPEYTPHGLQVLVEQFEKQPCLTLVEAPTGSGKTEAALAYASRLLAEGVAESIIFALPTQATANAMLTRIEEVAGHLFFDGANVVLAHGKRAFNQNFINLKEASKARTAQGKEEALVQCSEWLSSSKKRVFLGQIGVCTIDQVLLSVLPVRHNFVRSFGIQKSVLIIDEVHAYDSYMYGLLNEVLTRQHHAGGSAILLSATLPQYQRNQLIRSWDCENILENKAYPLVTQARSGKVCFHILDKCDRPKRRNVKIEICASQQLKITDELINQISNAAKHGAMIAVICNLVADAQKLALKLKNNSNVEVDLFHSRYRFVDRQRHEENVKNLYGKNSKRHGRILVATQVVEQSLDLDFDWMITQLCPVDLLFQRLGRLHRHDNIRPKQFEQPICVIVVPEQGDLDYGNSQYVYQNHRALWRTQTLLDKSNEIVFPKAYREWIEQVYQNNARGDEPPLIKEGYKKFEEEQEAKRYVARQMIKSKVTPYSDDDEKVTALTRDSEMSLSVVPVIIIDGGRCILDGDPLDKLEDWQKWETINQHTVNVPKSWYGLLPEPDKTGIHYLEMLKIGNDEWQAEVKDGYIHYSIKYGMERTIS